MVRVVDLTARSSVWGALTRLRLDQLVFPVLGLEPVARVPFQFSGWSTLSSCQRPDVRCVEAD